MGRPKRQPGQVETRDRILKEAELAFAERGFDGTPLETIAQRAGIRRPSLLYHFATKQALYSAVIEVMFQDLRIALAEAMATEGHFEYRLTAVTTRFDQYVTDRPQAAQLLLREILDNRGSGHEILLAGAAPVLEMLEAFVRSGPETPAVPIREALLAVACGRFVHAAAGPLGPKLWGPKNDIGGLAQRLFSDSG